MPRPIAVKVLSLTISTVTAFSLLTVKAAWCGHKEHHTSTGSEKATKQEDVLKEIAELRAQAAKLEAALQSDHKGQATSMDAARSDESSTDGHSSHHGDSKDSMSSKSDGKMPMGMHKEKHKMGSMTMSGAENKKPMGMHGMKKMKSMNDTGDKGQSSSDEHSKHHGGAKKGMGMMGGGMGDMMGKMMEQMGAPKPKDLYPSLMSLPDLPPEERQDIDRKAHNRMKSGAELMTAGLKSLSEAAPSDNFDNMQKSLQIVREGLSQFDSGLAAHRAIAEGKAPKKIALKWFKKEMGLIPPDSSERDNEILGMSWFHFFVMVLLTGFSLGMIIMYFFKMRRAEQLLQKIASTPNVNGQQSEEK